ncbi:MAG TPA: GNAT family N-acetyltransferase [Nevskiaceae bacterium]
MRRPVLPDLLRPGLALVFCGTAASRASAAAHAYYAHPGNAFWPTLAAVGLTPRRFAPSEFRELLGCGIGLTDLAKFGSGTDVELPADAFDVAGLRNRILRFAPRWLAFTSKRGARAYRGAHVGFGEQPWSVGTTRVFVLPSPSGQARATWDIRWWRRLARLVRDETTGLEAVRPTRRGPATDLHANAAAERFVIRPARAEDIAALLRLEALFPSDALSRRAWRRLMGSASASAWVAVCGRQVVASAILLVRTNTRVGRLYSLVVDPACRGRGLAARLLSCVHAAARAAGKSAMSLEVRPDNRAAIGLYERTGYRPVARLPAFYEDGSDALRMRCALQDAGPR